MRIRGHISRANRSGVVIAGWARHALALAMTLFLVVQAGSPQWMRGGSGHGSAMAAAECQRPGVALGAGAPHLPGTSADHDCSACLACVFSAIDARPSVQVAPAITSRLVFFLPSGVATPHARRRAAHPARAPPLFS
ncbi:MULTISPECIES: hypothetical protein [unclassified Methylocystis]|uniref:hypothetical protein n=1 Tax=unclassified Methylocystis TaxID=2625913 RepID=UPI001922B7A2|nr:MULTISPECIES: hypothetical protein [unclassified Methylocystis]MBL1256165.1 hypothetical protein [Methylocystis sp. Sn-Cys]MDJ0448131.1 hypothetical protein [Methylocystis sp. JR02]